MSSKFGIMGFDNINAVDRAGLISSSIEAIRALRNENHYLRHYKGRTAPQLSAHRAFISIHFLLALIQRIGVLLVARGSIRLHLFQF